MIQAHAAPAEVVDQLEQKQIAGIADRVEGESQVKRFVLELKVIGD